MQYIDGIWQEGSSKEFSSLDPSTQKVVWQGKAASLLQVDRAVLAANKAFSHWFDEGFERRCEFLEEFGEELEAIKGDFASLISQEVGKPLWESKGELSSMINKIAISISAFKERCSDKVQETAHLTQATRYKAHGAVAVLGPYNFPGHLPNGHIIPALLAGNTVVFKPSELAPACAELYAHVLDKVGLPQGVFNLVHGAGDVGAHLASHPSIGAVFFVGSSLTGIAIAKSCVDQPGKILALEMGGNNPLIFDEVENVKAAAYLTIQSAFLSCGQRCTCARRLIIVKGPTSDSFLQELLSQTAKIRVGAATGSPEPFMGPLVSQKAAKNAKKAVDTIVAMGAKTLTNLCYHENSCFVSPCIIDCTGVKHPPDDEIFAPILQVFFVNSLDEAIERANATRYGLSAGLLSDRRLKYSRFFSAIRAGVINWNRPTTGASSSAPFGGVGLSGNGRPSAYFACDYCSYPTASMEAPFVVLPDTLSPGLQ